MNRISLWILLGLVAVLSRVSLVKVYRCRQEHLPIRAGLLVQALIALGALLTAGLALLVSAPLVGPVLTTGALLLVCGQALVRRLQLDQS